MPSTSNNGQITTSSGVSGISNNMFKSQANDLNHVGSASSERSMELMRLKKEYNQMVKQEISKTKKDKEFYSEAHTKSPDRSGAQTVSGYYAHSYQNSTSQKSPYIHASSEYNGSNKKK